MSQSKAAFFTIEVRLKRIKYCMKEAIFKQGILFSRLPHGLQMDHWYQPKLQEVLENDNVDMCHI